MRKLVLFTIGVALSAPLSADVPCPSAVSVNVPASSCRLGSAFVSVNPVSGATYEWSVVGGAIVSGDGTPKVVLSFADAAKAEVAVTVNSGPCRIQGRGVVELRDPFAADVTAEGGFIGEPMTIRWTYSGGEPMTQTLTGTDFPEPLALASSARSYTYTPSAAGAKEARISASSTGPVSSRRRAVAGPRDSATSSCTIVYTAATYQVQECAKPGFSIHAPKTVLSGATFEARSEGNATAVHWTIVNGSPATWNGPVVTVRAGDSGKVLISAVGEKPPCHNTASDSLSVEIVKELTCDQPVAAVSAGKVECDFANVNATFKGTAPFSGTWSDGVTFSTSVFSISRRVTAPGSYSITKFADSICDGTSTGTATIGPIGASATISSKTSCANDKVTVQFTGKPPFWGRWSDDVSFETNEMTISRLAPAPSPFDIPGPFTIKYFYDANDCRGRVTGAFDVHEVTKVYVSVGWPGYQANDCITHPPPDGIGEGTNIIADFQWGTLPLTAVWSDGVTTTAEHWPIYRVVNPQETTTYTVVSAHDAYCQSEIVQPSTTVWVSQRPEIVLPNLTEEEQFGICYHTTRTARLAVPLQPGTTVTWSAQNATIASGQGTKEITFTTGENGPAVIGCAFAFNDKRCPTSSEKKFNVTGIPPPPIVTIEPSTIPPGGTAIITYKYGLNSAMGYLSSTRNDEITVIGATCPDHVCKTLFQDKLGVGKNTITVHAKGYCGDQEVTGSATITIAQ